MHKAATGVYADMRLVSDTPGSPFLGLVRFKGRVRGPCSSWSFKAQVKVASTMEPPRAVIPAALRLWRIFASVVASGTCACMRSTCTEALIGPAIQDSIFKFSRLKRANMT